MNPRRTLAATAILVASFVLAVPPPAEAATTRVLAITSATAAPQVPFQAFDGNPPKVFDINGDGKLEIIAQNDNQWVYVFDSSDGLLLFEAKTRFPAGWGARSFNGPEVAILSEDGKVRLVVANSAAYVTSYRFDPVGSTSKKFAFVKEWERRLSDCYSNPGMDSKPVIADLDQDGTLEILAATEEVGVYALRLDGRLYWKNCISGGNAEPAVGDVTGDGKPDVVFGSDGGVVSALNGRTGATIWTYNIRANFVLGSASMPVGPGLGQLDGKGGLDVVVGARDSHDANDWSQDHALLLALDGAGKVLWARQDPQGHPLTYTRPIIVDADEDGQNEVYWADWNTNGHKPPFDAAEAWQNLGPAHVYRYGAAGALVWRQTIPNWWSNKDLAIADVDGDGVQEVLANGVGPNTNDGIWYLDVRDGSHSEEDFIDTWPYSVLRGPVVADLWATGTMQWIVPAGPVGPGSAHGILVYDTGEKYSSAWPHLPYPGVSPAPSPPPPPPPGTFGATFTIKAPNAWWQEVFVDPDSPRTISRVDVRINLGAWKPMTLRSWGAWASSYNSPSGSRVEFLATDAQGSVSQSEPFTWLDGTLTRRSTTDELPPPPPPPPSTFNATFEVPDGVNEWWVEVIVGTTEPLAGVDARVNNGTWTALAPTSWGSWAKSFFVATGSRVQFRATTTFNATATSEEFRWLEDPGAPFSATFEPRSVGNDWWVEAKVVANEPLAGVDANVNNGTWTPLGATSWGTWAKSFHVPDGSAVRFRATSQDGDTLVSPPTVWS